MPIENTLSTEDKGELQYDVALSFAGENRDYVEMVAYFLKSYDVRCFYDNDSQVDLWGKDLYSHLIKIYRDQSRYVVMFISQYYKEKRWTDHERKAAQARAFKEIGSEYILPVRFDDTVIDGILETTGRLDLRRMAPYELAVKICEKVGKPITLKKANAGPRPNSPSKSGLARFDYSNHDGHFIIGKEPYDFETAWSKASEVRIHCYNDPSSIRGVALAPIGATLESLTQVDSFDFSSRSRSVNKGQFVILENHKGYFAALHIDDIKDSTRGVDKDELTFTYWILTDGRKDFSRMDVTE